MSGDTLEMQRQVFLPPQQGPKNSIGGASFPESLGARPLDHADPVTPRDTQPQNTDFRPALASVPKVLLSLTPNPGLGPVDLKMALPYRGFL